MFIKHFSDVVWQDSVLGAMNFDPAGFSTGSPPLLPGQRLSNKKIYLYRPV